MQLANKLRAINVTKNEFSPLYTTTVATQLVCVGNMYPKSQRIIVENKRYDNDNINPRLDYQPRWRIIIF
jgi:hypothetical protein